MTGAASGPASFPASVPARPHAPSALAAFLAARPPCLRAGPLAVILCEDDTAIAATLSHAVQAGFRHVLALSAEPLALPGAPLPAQVTNVLWNTRAPAAHVEAVNAVIAAVPPGTWLHYAFNAEFLFHPFAETRSVGEMLAFHAEERREAMLTTVIDLYPAAAPASPDLIDRMPAMLDSAGYFALDRARPNGRGSEERQLDLYGGLRWRLEDHLPADRRRIDRIGLFRARPDLRISADHRCSIPEHNTFACPWHHSLTATIASFRLAKALMRNPGSRAAADRFVHPGSVPFDWRAQQLLDLGLMEPGQWF